MRRITISGLALIVLVAFSTMWWQGCGLDPAKKPPIKPDLPNFPPESPSEVMDNVKYAYTYFKRDLYDALIDPAFLFLIWSGDAGNIDSDLVENGAWGRETELDLVDNMLTPEFIPQNPITKEPDGNYTIDNMTMVWGVHDSLSSTNLVGAPPGILQGLIDFSLTVTTRGNLIYNVESTPRFYFKPDSSSFPNSPVTYTIWRVEDGANLNNPTMKIP